MPHKRTSKLVQLLDWLRGREATNERIIMGTTEPKHAPETAAERDRLKAVNAELLEARKGLLAYHYPARSLGLKSAEYRAAKAAIAEAEK